jgi:branched-chain amino acid transport system permease protein
MTRMSGGPSADQSTLPRAGVSAADASDPIPEPRRHVDLQLLVGRGLVIVSVVLPAVLGNPYWTHNFTIVSLFITVAVLQNLLLSDAGQVSFGQGAVFGAGAYMTGIVSGLWGYPFAIGFLSGLGASIAMGLLFAAPALRVQSFYLGFVTLSAALVFPEMLVAFSDITNGINGIALPVPILTTVVFAGLSWISIFAMALATLSLVFHAWFRTTALGRTMRVAAVSPEAALTLGASPGQLRFIAFTIAAIGTGIAGVLYAVSIAFVSPYAFRVDLSIFFFFSVIVGGSGRLIGPVVGTAILYLVPNALLADLASYRLLAYGAVALVIMLVFPDGVVGTMERAARRYRARTRVSGIDFKAVLRESAAAPQDTAPPIGITVRGARKAYGKMVALNSVDVTVTPGQIHAIVGPNGSGKTTLLNAISGLARLDHGEITIGTTDPTKRPTYHAARLGLGRTFQTPRVFEDMSIWDNLRIGADSAAARRPSWLLASFERHRVHWSAEVPDTLPHAQRRLLEVLRVLAMDSRILLLDEPAAGLSSEERQDLADLLRMARDKMGRTIVLIEHDLGLVWQIADRITVLDAGEVIAAGMPAEILADQRVRNLFAGSPPKVATDA